MRIPGLRIVRISAITDFVARDNPVLSLERRLPSYDNTLKKSTRCNVRQNFLNIDTRFKLCINAFE